MTPSVTEQGFSLMEALVAMLVLAVGAAGLIRATEAHVDSIRALELRAGARWAAENRLVELGLPGDAKRAETETMLGQRYRIVEETRSTDDPDLRAVTVAVGLDGKQGSLVTLDGFVDAGTTTR